MHPATLFSRLRYWGCALWLMVSVAASADAPTAAIAAPVAEPVAIASDTQAPASQAASITKVDTQAATSASVATNTAPQAFYNKSSPGTAGHVLNVVLALCFITLLIIALAWFVRRFGSGVVGSNGQMHILMTLPLGTRERLLLVDVAGQHLLLGVTANNINCLHVFPEPVSIPAAGAGQSEFARKLLGLLQPKGDAASSLQEKP